MVEQCKKAIAERNRIIALQPRTAPTIGDEKQSNDTWWERSLPTSERRSASRSARQPSRGWWQQWRLWFAIGVAIVLLIWWLQR